LYFSTPTPTPTPANIVDPNPNPKSVTIQNIDFIFILIVELEGLTIFYHYSKLFDHHKLNKQELPRFCIQSTIIIGSSLINL